MRAWLVLGGLLACAAVAPSVASAQEPDPVIAAAGDIACDPASSAFNGGVGTNSQCRQMATSDLLVGTELSAVLPLGDLQYDCGGYSAFLASYDPSWGRVKSITRPAVGNHEYQKTTGTDCDPTGTAAGYYGYFGTAAGDPAKGYYSYDIGAWHLVALNSNCSKVGGCGAGSPQEQWLRQDLAASTASCTLAYWHHPLFSSGNYTPGISAVRPLFQALYDHGADVVLNGHDHNYERFARQTPTGAVDPTGVRQFIAGTGGKVHYAQSGTPVANSEVRNADTFGVLRLTLRQGGYDWRFVPVSGKTFTDSGSDGCIGAPPDGTPPTAPGSLAATSVTWTSVTLGWQASSDDVGVVAYDVYRHGTLIATVTGTTYTDTSVQGGNTYTYEVKARDAAGNTSPPSTVTVTTPVGASLTFYPDADAKIEEQWPNATYATTDLRVDNDVGFRAESYLRFTVTGVTGFVREARLRLYALNPTVDGPALHGTASAWDEATLSWSNRPASTSGPYHDTGAINTGEWVDINALPIVTGNGTFTFALKATSGDGNGFASRETPALRPELRVAFEPNTYARPGAAARLRVPLVPAYRECDPGRATKTHAQPLSGSCDPVASSQELTVGTPDANGQSSQSSGHLKLQALLGDPATAADEADVSLAVSVTDVRKRSGLADYGGQLQASLTLRATDRHNGSAGGTGDAASVSSLTLPVAVPCSGTVDAAIGSTCVVDTSIDAAAPGAVLESKRSVWELGRIQVLDGGPDGSAATADNGVFLVQGVLVP